MKLFATTDANGKVISRGVNNRANDYSVPVGSVRNAVNVDYDSSGNMQFPRIGSTRVYSGTNTHSWFEYEHSHGLGLFVEGSSLKRLNAAYTATTLATVGASPMSYCVLDETVYFSNGITSGRYRNGAVSEWGIEVPYNQLTATATPVGGLYGGDYLVTLTWLCNGEESGADESVSVTVQDGGGITLTNFPTPPSYVDGVAVYVSSVDDTELYLYNDESYPADVQQVDIQAFDGAVPLESQFLFKPMPGHGLIVHNGRLFWYRNKIIGYTEAQQYGYQKAGNFILFEDLITNLITTPGPLLISTERAWFTLSGMDAGQPTLTQIKPYGAAKCLPYYDTENELAYVMSDVGLVELSANGIRELHRDRVATPLFNKGCLAVVDNHGARRLVAICQGGTVSPLQHADYTTLETTRKGNGL